MNKKSQGLSVHTIIIAVIALIVLVVLIAIFTGRLGVFTAGISKAGTCGSIGGKCQSTCAPENRIPGALDCNRDFDADGVIDNPNTVCCKSTRGFTTFT